MEAFAAILGVNRYTDVQQAWEGVFASIESRRTIGGANETLAYRSFHQAIVTAAFYMEELCKILNLTKSARSTQLNSIRWPVTLLPSVEEDIDDDQQDMYEPVLLDTFQVLKAVKFFIRRFRMKTPVDPPVENLTEVVIVAVAIPHTMRLTIIVVSYIS